MFCHGRGRWNEEKIKQVDEYLAGGGGFVVVHSAIITDSKLSQKLAEVIGQTWEQGYTRFRHGAMDLKITAAEHPICQGLPKTIGLLDEAYWPFRGDESRIQILATSEETISKDSEQTRPEPMFWTYRRGKGRVFGCVLGHYNWTFDDPYFRVLLLRGMAWAANESPYLFDELVLHGAPVDKTAQGQIRVSSEYETISEDFGTLAWLAGKKIGNAENLTVGRVTIKAGKTNPRHRHPKSEEVLYLLKGSLEHTAGDQSFTLSAGDTITIAPGVFHNATCTSREDADMIVVYSQGIRGFEPE
jgi:quercetin dioxygenase-like cupin family protein